MNRFILLLAIPFSFSCHKTETRHPNLPMGIYKGSFQRMHLENSPVAAVTLNFQFPAWSGSTNIQHYPALGNGSYNYNNDALAFDNKGIWTADFDWSLILDGFYIDRVQEDSLFLSKSYGNGWIDVYKLKKQ